MSTVILGLDPGATTGFAKCAFEGEKITVLDYGIVPMRGADVDSLVSGVQSWIQNCYSTTIVPMVFSAIPYIPGRTTHHASIEVQGVIRAAGGLGYNPATIHSQLGTRNKADTKAFVKRVLGFAPTSIDHVADAFAVCFCHALKIGVWQPHIEALPTRTPEARQKRRGGHPGATDAILGDNPSQEEIKAAFERGEARTK